MNRKQHIAEKLRKVHEVEDIDTDTQAILIEAAVLLEQDYQHEELEGRLEELERWQKGFDEQWSEFEIELHQIYNRLSHLETDQEQ